MMMQVIEGKFREDVVTINDVIDALEGVAENREIASAVAIVEDTDGNLLILPTDMTNTELVGLMSICMANYIHNFQHPDIDE